MKPTTRYLADMLDLDSPLATEDILFRGGRATAARQEGADVLVTVPFIGQQKGKTLADADAPEVKQDLRVRAYGDAIVRVTWSPDGGAPLDPSPMLEWDASLKPEPLHIEHDEQEVRLLDTKGQLRASFCAQGPADPEMVGTDVAGDLGIRGRHQA